MPHGADGCTLEWMQEHGLPVEASGQPVDGWRVWNLHLDRAGHPELLPAGSGVDAWRPREPVQARCGKPSLLRAGRSHPAPDPRCTCGIYARREPDRSARVTPSYPVPPVIGTVSLWGRVIEHEEGWRGAFAYPSRLTLACTLCLGLEPGTGQPAVVHGFAGQLYPLCEDHRGGVQLPDGRRTKDAGVAPLVLRSALLDTYGVDLLPFGPVAEMCRRAAAPPPPAYWPVIRAVR